MKDKDWREDVGKKKVYVIPWCCPLAIDLPVPKSSFSKIGYTITEKILLGIKKAEKNLNFLNSAYLLYFLLITDLGIPRPLYTALPKGRELTFIL